MSHREPTERIPTRPDRRFPLSASNDRADVWEVARASAASKVTSAERAFRLASAEYGLKRELDSVRKEIEAYKGLGKEENQLISELRRFFSEKAKLGEKPEAGPSEPREERRKKRKASPSQQEQGKGKAPVAPQAEAPESQREQSPWN